MKSLLLLLALRLAASDKLDRTYLPPPGSKYAGGEPGDLQAPLEFPGAYTTTSPLTTGQKETGLVTIGDTRVVPGISRGSEAKYPGPSGTVSIQPPNVPGPNFPQNTYQVPTTTTSYAFTQTTTFPPTESFETTQKPLLPGFPINGPFGSLSNLANQPFNQGQTIQQTGPIIPGSILPGNQVIQRPVQPPITSMQSSFPNGQTILGPAHTQNQNVTPQKTFPPTSISSFSGSTAAPSLATSPYSQGQGYTQHLGVQPPSQYNQPGGTLLQPGLSTTAQSSYNNLPSQYDYNIGNIVGQRLPSSNEGPQQGLTQFVDNNGNVQNVTPGYTVTQQQDGRQQINGKQPLSKPGQNLYGGDLNAIPGISGGNVGFPQHILQGQSFGGQGSFSSPELQGTPVTGIIPGQQVGTRPQIQQQIYPPGNVQGTSLPTQAAPQGQQFSGPQNQANYPYLQGSSSVQGNLSPQLDNQQGLPIRRPNYPFTGISQSPTQSGGLQYQGIGQQSPQGLFTPGELNVSTGQQGALLPTLSPQNGINLGYPTGQQGSPPSTGLTQAFGPDSSFSRQPVQNILPGSNVQQGALPGQQNFVRPGTPFGQTQVSQQQPSILRPGENGVFSGSTTPGYNQPFFSSTTPSSIPSYATTPGSIYPTSSPTHAFSSTTPNSISSYSTTPGSIYPSSSTTPNSIPSYSTTPGPIYPSSSPANVVVSPINIRPRPERPQAQSDRDAAILNYDSVLTPEGYAHSFDTSNGIHADENGTTIDGTKANGSYSYIGDDGKLYSVVYTADEHGFRPQGEHLPTPPPIPAAIQRVIEQAARDKEAGVSHDGFYDEDKYGHKKYQSPKNRRPGMQDRIADDDSSSKFYDKLNGIYSMNKIGTKGEKRPNIVTNGLSSGENDFKYASEDDISDVNQPSFSGRPTYRKPGQSKIEQQNEDFMKDKESRPDQRRPIQDQDRRRPSKPGFIKMKPTENQYDDVQKYNQQRPGTKQDQRRPIRPSFDEVNPTSDQYDDQRNESKELLEDGEGVRRKQPGKTNYDKGTRITNKDKVKYGGIEENEEPERYYENESPVTRRPQSERRPDYDGTRFEQDSDDFKQIDGGNKIQSPVKGFPNIYGMRGEIIGDKYDDSQEVNVPTGSHSQNKGFVGKTQIKRPGHDQVRQKQPESNYPKGSKYDEENSRLFNQRPKQFDTKYPVQSLDDETGYQYTPPQNKFDQVEANKFPSRISDKIPTSRPSSKYDTYERKTTIQPFITPNVSRDEDESYEDSSEEYIPSNISGKEMATAGTPGYEDKTTATYGFDEHSDENDDKITIGLGPVFPSKANQNRRPVYQDQKTTNEPQYFDQHDVQEEYQNLTPDHDEKDKHKPGPHTNAKDKRPGQKYPSRTPGSSYLPEYGSTTPMTPGKPYRPNLKESSRQEEQSQYTTEFEPSETEEDVNDDRTQPGKSTSFSGSKRPVSSPGDRVSSVESSTGTISRPSEPTRPIFVYSDEKEIPGSPTIRPGISESAFGAPSVRPGSLIRPGYTMVTTISETKGQEAVPTKSGGGYPQNRPSTRPFSFTGTLSSDKNVSRVISGRPGLSKPGKNFPSTTYRPNYSITDISEPSSVAVDDFGRPLQPFQSNKRPSMQPGQTRPLSGPGFLGVAEEELSTGDPTSHPDITRPGSSYQVTFKPTETRFGTPGLPGNVQGTPGPKPAEFGPSAISTPGYLSPYGTSTEGVIGEDFSGPKQTQRFDPQTGYYY